MTQSFDELEYPETPAPLPTDTLADSVLILLGLTAVQRLVGFVRAVLFCRWLDAEQLGLWDMAFSFLLLAAPLSVLAIPGTFGRYLEHFRQRGRLHAFFRWTAAACFGLTLIAIGILLTFREWFSTLIFGEDQSSLFALASLCLLTVIAFNFLIELFTAMRSIRLVSVMQLVNSIAFAVLGVGLLLGWQCSAASVLFSYGGSCLVAILWATPSLRRLWHGLPDDVAPMPQTMLWSRIAPFAGWILLGSVLTNLFGVLDRYMIIHFSNLSSSQALDLVGNYHSSRVVPLLLVSIAAMLGTMMTPHLTSDWETGRREQATDRLRLMVKLVGFMLFLGAVAVLLAAPLLFGTAFRGKFHTGLTVLPWTLIYCTWFGIGLIVQNYLICVERARLISVALASGLGLNIALNVVLLPRLGLEGAVFATAAANALSLVLICLFNRRFGFHLDDGAELIMALPMLLSLGPWVALAAGLLVFCDAIWADRILSPNEKRQILQLIDRYGGRFGIDRLTSRYKHGEAKR